MPSITCNMCGKKGARARRVTRSYAKGKAEFLIRGIPVISCPHCGESYLTAETVREVDRIKRECREFGRDTAGPRGTVRCQGIMTCTTGHQRSLPWERH